MEYLAALNAFCLQLNEFCLLYQREILRREPPDPSSASAELAQYFAETLILCPTVDAARNAIGRDLAGARSFLMAADRALRRIRSQVFQFATECPPYQTRFYLLSCAVEEILQAPRNQILAVPKAVYPGKVPALPA